MSAILTTPLPGRSARGVHVAVSHAGTDDGVAPPGWTERRAQQRRLHDRAVVDVVHAAPGVALAALCALAAALLVMPPRWSTVAWALATAALWMAWAVRPCWWFKPRPRLPADRAFQMLTALCLTMLSLMAWLPVAAAQRRLLGVLMALVALAVVFGLAPLGRTALLAALLPGSAALSQAWHVPHDPADTVAALLAAVWAGAVVTWLGKQRQRHWRTQARTLLKQEDQLRAMAAERDQALRADADKTRFLAAASHDLRQPVHAIGLFAATLERRLHGTDHAPCVRNVICSIDALERSFNAMLDVARLDTGSIEPNVQHFPLRDVFRRMYMQFAGLAELRGLSLRFSPGGKSVTSDPQLLERLLSNLIQNALKYTDHGGVVVVARTTATHINIEVWDTGTGMSAVELPRVFDEFYQVGRSDRTRAHGLGMGLAIVKRLAQLLRHDLTVVSQPGKGTMFRIGVRRGSLDAVTDAATAADTLPMPDVAERTVLVIDDEACIREGLRELLQAWGHQVMVAASARDAEVAQRNLRTPPDLVLSDLHLGDGPDGIEAIAAVRRHWGFEVPAVLVTGDTTHQELRRATESSLEVLVKPVPARRLLEILSRLPS